MPRIDLSARSSRYPRTEERTGGWREQFSEASVILTLYLVMWLFHFLLLR